MVGWLVKWVNRGQTARQTVMPLSIVVGHGQSHTMFDVVQVTLKTEFYDPFQFLLIQVEPNYRIPSALFCRARHVVSYTEASL